MKPENNLKNVVLKISKNPGVKEAFEKMSQYLVKINMSTGLLTSCLFFDPAISFSYLHTLNVNFVLATLTQHHGSEIHVPYNSYKYFEISIEEYFKLKEIMNMVYFSDPLNDIFDMTNYTPNQTISEHETDPTEIVCDPYFEMDMKNAGKFLEK